MRVSLLCGARQDALQVATELKRKKPVSVFWVCCIQFRHAACDPLASEKASALLQDQRRHPLILRVPRLADRFLSQAFEHLPIPDFGVAGARSRMVCCIPTGGRALLISFESSLGRGAKQPDSPP